MRNRRGNVMLLFALAAVPVFAAVGAAIDLSLASRAKTSLISAADSAALIAARTASDRYSFHLSDNKSASEAWSLAVKDAQSAGRQLFTANAPTSLQATPAFGITKNDQGVFIASVTFDGTVSTTVAGIMGFKTIPLKGVSEAKYGVFGTQLAPQYADVYVLLDRSGSMMIGATTADVNATVGLNLHGDNCMFACHQDKLGVKNDLYTVAKGAGVNLKFDVALQALSNVISSANPDFHRIAVYSIGNNEDPAASGVPSIGLTNNFSFLRSQQAAMPPERTGLNDPTPISMAMMNLFNNAISRDQPVNFKSGDGTTREKRKVVLVLVSDGVEDIHAGRDWTGSWIRGDGRSAGAPYAQWPGYSWSGSRIRNSGSSSICDALKQRIDVAVLQVEYPDLSAYNDRENRYNRIVRPIASRISAAMQSCASDGSLYFSANQQAGAINAGASSIFRSALYTMKKTLALTK